MRDQGQQRALARRLASETLETTAEVSALKRCRATAPLLTAVSLHPQEATHLVGNLAEQAVMIATMYQYSLPESTPGLVACWQSMTLTPSTGGCASAHHQGPTVGVAQGLRWLLVCFVGLHQQRVHRQGLRPGCGLHEWGVHYNSNVCMLLVVLFGVHATQPNRVLLPACSSAHNG